MEQADAGEDASIRPEAGDAERPLRILVADDNKPFAETLTWVLQDIGHKVVACHNGFDALNIARRFRPDVVILDIVMPVMHGYDVCRRLRADPAAAGAQIFGLTGYDDALPSEMERDGLFDRRFTKPVDLPRFMRLLEDIRRNRARALEA